MVFRKSSLDNGHSDADWKEGWEKMRKNGQYLVDYFSDLFVIGKYQVAWPSLPNKVHKSQLKQWLLLCVNIVYVCQKDKSNNLKMIFLEITGRFFYLI